MFRLLELHLVAVGQHLRDAKVLQAFSIFMSTDLRPEPKEPPPGWRRHMRVIHSMRGEHVLKLAFVTGRRTLRAGCPLRV